MGLESIEKKVSNYLTIVNGHWAQRYDVHEQVEGSVTRKLEKGDNAGQTVRERYYRSVTGVMEEIKLAEKPWGSIDLEITLKLIDVEGSPCYTLVIPSNNRLFYDFAKRVPNIDCTPEITTQIGIGSDKDNGKTRLFLYMKQNGEKVPMHYTKDNPDGMPEPVERKGKGWDYSEREDWLYTKLEEFVQKFNDGVDEEIPF